MSLTRSQKEFKLQVHIVEKHNQYFPHVLMTAFPGRPGDARDGFFKKMMGVKPGVSDILIWWRGASGSIELKVEARVSSGQNKWMSAFSRLGGKTGVVHSWREYYKLLCSWGINPMHECTLFDEPDFSSESEKFQQAADFFRPPPREN